LRDLKETKLTTEVLNYITTLSSSGAGVINSVFSNSPSAAGGWSNLASSYDEYRTLAIEVSYRPDDRYNRGVSVSTAPIYVVIDHDNNGALTTQTQASQYSSVKQFSLDDPWKIRCGMSDVAEGQFINTGSPASQYFVKMYCGGVSLSATYGDIMVSYRVQFRGKGI
jgi:hypothetical protein